MKLDLSSLLAQLKQEHMRVTSCRKAMLEKVSMLQHPFTAEELLNTLAPQLPIHRATIYRDLALFAERGILRQLSFPGIPTAYYELCSKKHHHHFICQLCHSILDVDTDEAEHCISEIEKGLQHKGIRVQSHVLKFYGICTRCQ